VAYHIYTTRGFIIKGKPLNESDKYYSIFTENLGLVGASARSVRKSESKLRYSLSDYSLSELAFVRGKTNWRITHAREIENLHHTFAGESAKEGVVARVLEMLQKLLSGEEKHSELFTLIADSFHFLSRTRMSTNELRTFETILMLRILRLLGYGKEGRAYESCVNTTAWSGHLLDDAMPHMKDMQKDLGEGIMASQL
jgi:DNA repair protein RecO